MKKLVLLFLLLIACSQDNESYAVVGLGNPDPMQKPCAVDFVRASPNYCQRTSSILVVVIGGFTTPTERRCQSFDFSVLVPSSASVIIARFSVVIRASNAVGVREISYGEANSACTILKQNLISTTYEFVARPVSTLLYRSTADLPIVLNGSLSPTFYAELAGADTSSLVMVDLVGYYD